MKEQNKMEQVYDNDLIGGLGDLLGLDPYITGEADFSSLYQGEIGKQDSYTSSQYATTGDVQLDGSLQPESDLDGLLSEGRLLLDQLMEDNGLGLDSSTVDLSSIDELAFRIDPLAQPTHTQATITEPTLAELVSQLPADEPVYASGASSPISTLPSEPSSPMFIDDEMFGTPCSPVPSQFASSPITTIDSVQDETFDDILASLMAPEPLVVMAEEYAPMAYSPGSSESGDSITSADTSYELASKPIRSQKSKKAKTPYSKLPASRKERKKLQNKEAANRYRQKKKDEIRLAAEEEDGLQRRNQELKSEVLNLEREIMCLKDLLTDVFDVNSF